MAAEEAIVVRSQLIALEGLKLILPNTAIAEVVAYKKPQPEEGKPDWFLGYTDWRGFRIPIISYEAMNNQPGSKPGKRSRIIVLNSISGDSNRSFYGMLSLGIPRLMSIESINIQNAPDIGEVGPLILRQVLIDGLAAIIPDQYEIEAQLKKHNLALTAEL